MINYSELLQGENMDILRNHPFFEGLSDAEITEFITFSAPELIELEPEQRITMEPGFQRRLGFILSGTVKVFTVDYSGSKTVINALENYGSVGTMQFMTEYYNLLFEIVADTPSKIVMFDPKALLTVSENVSLLQHKVLVNLMKSQRQLFVVLSRHLVCLSQKTVRAKVLRYLQIHSESAHSYEFEIPLSREELAAYLAVDRASLSRSLGELRREGAIEFRKNRFKILDPQIFEY